MNEDYDRVRAECLLVAELLDEVRAYAQDVTEGLKCTNPGIGQALRAYADRIDAAHERVGILASVGIMSRASVTSNDGSVINLMRTRPVPSVAEEDAAARFPFDGNDRTRDIAKQAYQVISQLAMYAAAVEDPNVQRALAFFSGGWGYKGTILPFMLPEQETVSKLNKDDLSYLIAFLGTDDESVHAERIKEWAEKRLSDIISPSGEEKSVETNGLERAGDIAGQAYQVIGEVASFGGVFNNPDVQRALTFFSRGWQETETILPYDLPDTNSAQERIRLSDNIAAALVNNNFAVDGDDKLKEELFVKMQRTIYDAITAHIDTVSAPQSDASPSVPSDFI